MELYTSIIVLTTLILTADGKSVKLDLPFKVYGQNIACSGKDVTYHLNNTKLAGNECIAKVDYRASDMPGTNVVDESAIAEAFPGNMGNEWAIIKKDARYKKHYNIKLSKSKATYDDEGNEFPYDGPDKDDLSKFTLWDDLVAIAAENDQGED